MSDYDELVAALRDWPRMTPIACKEAADEIGRLRALNAELVAALAFAASVIKSGEPWTPECEAIIGAAIAKAGRNERRASMKLWVVVGGHDYERFDWPLGVYSTEEKAQTAAKRLKEDTHWSRPDTVGIEVYELDKDCGW